MKKNNRCLLQLVILIVLILNLMTGLKLIRGGEMKRDQLVQVELLLFLKAVPMEDYPTAVFSGIEDYQVWTGNVTVNGSVATNNDLKEAVVTLKNRTSTFLHTNLTLTKDTDYLGPKNLAYLFEVTLNSNEYPNGSYTLFFHFLDTKGAGMIYHWDIRIANASDHLSPAIGLPLSFLTLFSIITIRRKVPRLFKEEKK